MRMVFAVKENGASLDVEAPGLAGRLPIFAESVTLRSDGSGVGLWLTVPAFRRDEAGALVTDGVIDILLRVSTASAYAALDPKDGQTGFSVEGSPDGRAVIVLAAHAPKAGDGVVVEEDGEGGHKVTVAEPADATGIPAP